MSYRAKRALGTLIEQTTLPNRARRWLRAAGVLTVADLIRRTEDDLLVIANISATSLAHVSEFLAERGLKLAPRRTLRCPGEWVRRALSEDGVGLTPRERQVLELRHGLPRAKTQTLEQVGQQLRITRERVRQVQKTAEQKVISHMIHERGERGERGE